MILFINFAPISFGGGVERWITAVSDYLSATEKVTILEVSEMISNVYSKFVLKRNFDRRFEKPPTTVVTLQVTWSSLIPFTDSWKKIRDTVRAASIIYSKLEVNETVLIIYYGGFHSLKKTIIGLHSPFLYTHDALSWLERLHNFVYTSAFFKYVLANARKIHVLNPDQKHILIDRLDQKNVIMIPNFIENTDTVISKTDADVLTICFIGELSIRKGADYFLDIVRHSPSHFQFKVIGDGPLKDEFSTTNLPNLAYLGYKNQPELNKIVKHADVLLMPSRAESFSLVSLEALSYGLTVICSGDIAVEPLEKFLIPNPTNSTEGYIELLTQVFEKKQRGQLEQQRKKQAAEVRDTFSKDSILNTISRDLFSIHNAL